MYLPEQFRESDPDRIAALVENHPFGMLVTAPEGAPFVSHLPFLLERISGSKGRLLGHMAKANPQWRHFGSEAVAIFHGPHAYISPSWYSSSGVPTWNYAVVHIRGKPVLIEDETDLGELLEKMTSVRESEMANPWKPDLEGERRSRLLGMITGFEIEITEIQAKFKLGQNRPIGDRERIIEALAGSGEKEIARLMAEHLVTNRSEKLEWGG